MTATTKISESKKAFLANCTSFELLPSARILVKTGISLELPIKMVLRDEWIFKSDLDKDAWTDDILRYAIASYAVADIRPRSGLALKHGITVLNTPGTIDNSYRKEIGVIIYNAGHEPYTITKGDKICQMSLRPLYPSKMEIINGSTGK